MWDLDNSTSYAAESNWVRDKEGAHLWLVAVRGTFDIMPDGELVVAEEQPPPPREPEFRGDPSTSSLVLDSDLLAPKPGTDVVLDAVAYAPNGRPARRVDVSLQVAGRSKTLTVHGPRTYERSATGGLTTSESAQFIDHPILYEWAFGGSDLKHPDAQRQRMDIANPVGKGVAADTRDLYGQPAHVVEPSGGSASRAGFGPIASFWSPRRERAGTYDSHWEQTRKPLLPEDFDSTFACSAPDDQWFSEPLVGGELITLTNVTPEGVLTFRLPRISLYFMSHFAGHPIEHEGSLATVLIMPHARKLSLVWQSALPVSSLEAEYLDFTFIAEDA